VIAGDVAVRDWVNAQTQTLTGQGKPLSGAFLHEQASPQSGAYCVIYQLQGSSDLVAEQDSSLATVSLVFLVYSMTQQASSVAAAALASAIEQLTGNPVPCGPAGADITILASDNLRGPVFAPAPAEEFAYQVTADFLLLAQP